jgi:hypothetical protein
MDEQAFPYMITPEKLRIYQRYRGDIDGWARIGIPEESNESHQQA